MDGREIIHELQSTLEELKKAQVNYYQIMEQRKQIYYEIEMLESKLVQDGKINGQNEDIRKAQKIWYTSHLRAKKREIEREENKRKFEYLHLKRKLENLQLAARIFIAEKTPSKIEWILH